MRSAMGAASLLSYLAKSDYDMMSANCPASMQSQATYQPGSETPFKRPLADSGPRELIMLAG